MGSKNTESGKGLKILAIDDNPGILFGLREALTIKGFQVEICETFNGVEYVEELAPDLIFLDISLVGKDGREVSRELKADKRTNHISIIILTAYPNASELAKEAGADDFLPKPFDLFELWKIAAKYTYQRVQDDGIHSAEIVSANNGNHLVEMRTLSPLKKL